MLELKPVYDTRKSFYGKATIELTESGARLYSYGTHIASMENGIITLFARWDFSQTTLRHTKEFIAQFLGVQGLTKRKIERSLVLADDGAGAILSLAS